VVAVIAVAVTFVITVAAGPVVVKVKFPDVVSVADAFADCTA
jgi:hypothetical protein